MQTAAIVAEVVKTATLQVGIVLSWQFVTAAVVLPKHRVSHLAMSGLLAMTRAASRLVVL